MFQSTFPQGERRQGKGKEGSTDDVSIHVPARGTTSTGRGNRYRPDRFNPRSRKGNDFVKYDFFVSSFQFQSTFPQGERLLRDRARKRKYQFQSTFPQGERHPLDVVTDTDLIVSIHVPARGTTARYNHSYSQGIVSIHVPARGTTGRRGTLDHFDRGFNPRSRKGNDGLVLNVNTTRVGFNPRSRKGNDVSPKAKRRYERMFQSTFPQGERLQPHAVCPVRTLVSIHVPARGTTVRFTAAVCRFPVSIHVPARGTTCRSPCFLVVFIVSIHVPARGTTSVAGSSGSVRMVSIHVPARGTTRRHGCCGYNNRVSIHVPARGTTRDAVSSVLPVKFQSTFPQGERLIRIN